MIEYIVETLKTIVYSIILFYGILYLFNLVTGLSFTEQDEYLLILITTTFVLLERRKLGIA